MGVVAGCSLNDVRPVSEPGHPPHPDRSIVVFGAAVEGHWPWQGYPISFYEYDLQKQSMTATCFRWNKIDAVADNKTQNRQYFVFDVAPGFYAGGPGDWTYLRGQPSTVAFEAPPGQVVYLGDFIYAKDQRVDLKYDLDALVAALSKSHPKLGQAPSVAKPVVVTPLRGFILCP